MESNFGPLGLDLSQPPKKVGPDRDGRVCICGHGAKNHGPFERKYFDMALTEIPRGGVSCVAGKHQCACELFEPVLIAPDLRRFMSRTIGPDQDHALARGVANATEAGGILEWKTDLVCGKCQTPGRLTPVAIRVGIDGSPILSRKTTQYNYLLCENCRAGLILEPDPLTLANVAPKGVNY